MAYNNNNRRNSYNNNGRNGYNKGNYSRRNQNTDWKNLMRAFATEEKQGMLKVNIKAVSNQKESIQDHTSLGEFLAFMTIVYYGRSYQALTLFPNQGKGEYNYSGSVRIQDDKLKSIMSYIEKQGNLDEVLAELADAPDLLADFVSTLQGKKQVRQVEGRAPQMVDEDEGDYATF